MFYVGVYSRIGCRRNRRSGSSIRAASGTKSSLDPPTSLTAEICKFFDNSSIYHWDSLSDKTKCFDCGDFAYVREIEDYIGAYVGLKPTLMDNIPMRSYGDSNNT
jgi:hypothetical protein